MVVVVVVVVAVIAMVAVIIFLAMPPSFPRNRISCKVVHLDCFMPAVCDFTWGLTFSKRGEQVEAMQEAADAFVEFSVFMIMYCSMHRLFLLRDCSQIFKTVTQRRRQITCSTASETLLDPFCLLAFTHMPHTSLERAAGAVEAFVRASDGRFERRGRCFGRRCRRECSCPSTS